MFGQVTFCSQNCCGTETFGSCFGFCWIEGQGRAEKEKKLLPTRTIGHYWLIIWWIQPCILQEIEESCCVYGKRMVTFCSEKKKTPEQKVTILSQTQSHPKTCFAIMSKYDKINSSNNGILNPSSRSTGRSTGTKSHHPRIVTFCSERKAAVLQKKWEHPEAF